MAEGGAPVVATGDELCGMGGIIHCGELADKRTGAKARNDYPRKRS
jgi:hypothetical protein